MQSVLNNVWEVIKEAADSPKAISARDLLTGVKGGALLLHPIWAIIGVCGYVVLKDVLKKVCASLNTNGKSFVFRQFALYHNLALFVFSFVSSVNVWSLTISHARRNGTVSIFCDSGTWEDGLKFWGLVFYLSKYWELVDTFLLIWKQRTPSFLQVYHHAVTIVCAYMLQASHTPITFLFVGLNATVHTVMYAYYALTIFGIRPGIKPMITIIQIVQFIVGNLAASTTFFLRNGQCSVQSQKIAVAAIMLHAFILIALFIDFFQRTYLRSQKAKQT